jgi:hypothetical protein
MNTHLKSKTRATRGFYFFAGCEGQSSNQLVEDLSKIHIFNGEMKMKIC